MPNAILYPGTFDPITNGHVDLAIRAAKVFDQVIVAVAEYTQKKTCFPFEIRVKTVQKALQKWANIRVEGFQGLFVEFAKQQKINLILRGVRAVTDFEYERQLSHINHHLAPALGLETIFMIPDEKYAHISSTFIRDIARLGGDISAFVPQNVIEEFKKTWR